MAYLQLAVLSSGNPTERMTWLNLAKKYESRVTERERLWIGVAEAQALQKSVAAAEQLRAIIARYPDEKDAYIRLGQLCLHAKTTQGQ